jgi:hypothetical protein
MCVIYLLHHQAFAGCAELAHIYVFLIIGGTPLKWIVDVSLINRSSPRRVQIEVGRQIESSRAA